MPETRSDQQPLTVSDRHSLPHASAAPDPTLVLTRLIIRRVPLPGNPAMARQADARTTATRLNRSMSQRPLIRCEATYASAGETYRLETLYGHELDVLAPLLCEVFGRTLHA